MAERSGPDRENATARFAESNSISAWVPREVTMVRDVSRDRRIR